jgi:PAS domain S-box-containing protein
MKPQARGYKFGVTQKGLILVLVPVLFELIFIAVLAGVLFETHGALEKLDHSKDAILALFRSQNSAVQSFIIVMNQASDKKISELEKLTAQFKPADDWGNHNQSVYPELNEVMIEALVFRESVIHIIDEKRKSLLSGGNYKFSRPLLYTAFLDMRRLSDRTLKIENLVREAEPAEMERIKNQLILFISCGLGLSAIISLWLARYFTSDIAFRLRRIRDQTHRLAARAELTVPEAGGDEIADLERVLYESSHELEKVRARESAILDNAADVICSLDAKLRFAGLNAAITNSWQYGTDEILGKSLFTLLVDEKSDETRSQFRLISESAGEGVIENVLRTKYGDLRNLLWAVKWSSEENQFYCVVHDVTEIRTMQKIKQQFLSIASHDMRTPLASVSIILERLLSEKVGSLPEKTRNELTKTQGTLVRLMELVNELLELEKLESGKSILAFDCVSAFDICAMACETLESMAAKAKVRIKKPNNDFALLGDERRLIQVLINLLSNAIKFSPAESSITLELRRVFAGVGPATSLAAIEVPKTALIEIRVSDQGQGIPAADRNLIFAKFRQARQSAATGVKGTGLGLAIVKAIVEGHGGDVGVDSEEGKGSTFWIRVPEFQGTEDDEP